MLLTCFSTDSPLWEWLTFSKLGCTGPIIVCGTVVCCTLLYLHLLFKCFSVLVSFPFVIVLLIIKSTLVHCCYMRAVLVVVKALCTWQDWMFSNGLVRRWDLKSRMGLSLLNRDVLLSFGVVIVEVRVIESLSSMFLPVGSACVV